MKPDFEDGMGYCDEFICSIHDSIVIKQSKPTNLGKSKEISEISIQLY